MNKANSIINNFLLAGDKCMPELHLRDPIVGLYLFSLWPIYKKHTKNSRFFKYSQDKLCLQK